MSESWRIELALLRQRAAARCGLAAYPAALVKVSERLDRGVADRAELERLAARRLAMAEELTRR